MALLVGGEAVGAPGAPGAAQRMAEAFSFLHGTQLRGEEARAAGMVQHRCFMHLQGSHLHGRVEVWAAPGIADVHLGFLAALQVVGVSFPNTAALDWVMTGREVVA